MPGERSYISIPQACKYTQTLSISSLAVYASHLRYFVIVTPDTIHVDKSTACDYATYSRRGWCRLEQWARLVAEGTVDLFKWSGDELELAFDEQHEKQAMVDSMMVCAGDFAVPRDIPKLIDTLLGLWAVCIARKGLDNTIAEVEQHVRDNYVEVFPEVYFDDLPLRMEALLEKRPDLLSTLAHEKSTHAIEERRGTHKTAAVQAVARPTATMTRGAISLQRSHTLEAQVSWLEKMEQSIKIPSTSIELVEDEGL